MATILYRPAEKSDVTALARIRAANWETEAYWMGRITGYREGTLHPQLALAPRVLYVATENGAVAGFIAGHLTKRFGCDGELEWIDVVAERRRMGIATELIRLLAGWFSEQKAKCVCVNVSPGNFGARRLYGRSGAEFLNEYWLVWKDIGAILNVRRDS